MGNEEEQKYFAETLSKDEIAELFDTSCNMAIVFKGKLVNLYQVIKFLKDKGCYICYKKSGKDRLIISVQKEGSVKDGNSKQTFE